MRVNNTVVKEPGTQVHPDRDRIEVHGRPIPGPSAMRYLMVHKPVGVITTLNDPEGRPTVRTLLPPGPRIFPVGRLDAETSGLLIVTNDGELAHHLMHPRFGVRKVYRVRTDRPPDPKQIRWLRSGVEFEPRVVSAPCEVRVRNARSSRAEIEIALHEGRYRQVRRMCEAVGLLVKGLHRSSYGPLRIGALPRGAWRDLTGEEVRQLRAASAKPVPRVVARRAPPRVEKEPGSPVPAVRGAEAMARARGGRPVARPATSRPFEPPPARRRFVRPATSSREAIPGRFSRPATSGSSRESIPGRFSRPANSRPSRPFDRPGASRPPAHAAARSRAPGTSRPFVRAATSGPFARAGNSRPTSRAAGTHPGRAGRRDHPSARPARGPRPGSAALGRPAVRGPSAGNRSPRPERRGAFGATRQGQRTGRGGPVRPGAPVRPSRSGGRDSRGQGGPRRPATRGRSPRY